MDSIVKNKMECYQYSADQWVITLEDGRKFIGFFLKWKPFQENHKIGPFLLWKLMTIYNNSVRYEF